MYRFPLIVFLFLLNCPFLTARQDSSAVNPRRLAFVSGSTAILAGSSLYALQKAWYQDYPQSSFHFFNDNGDWLMMDKAGHFTTAYYTGRVGVDVFRWTGMRERRAVWIGGTIGAAYLGAIEVMDGFSEGWGFSTGDFAANVAGSAFCIGQELLWKEQRITIKYSFRPSVYAAFRPGLLGKSTAEQLLKDYNGQTYWLSVNPAAFMKSETRFPRWLNVAIGYGADGMTGGSFNPPYIDQSGKQIRFERFRQYYLSFDIDLTRLPVRSKALKIVCNAFGFIKIPAPALEFSRRGISANLIGF